MRVRLYVCVLLETTLYDKNYKVFAVAVVSVAAARRVVASVTGPPPDSPLHNEYIANAVVARLHNCVCLYVYWCVVT